MTDDLQSDGLLAGRVAIITGAGRGIGYAVAERFAALGASLVLVDDGSGIDGRDPEKGLIEQQREALIAKGADGARLAALEIDIASPEAAARAVDLAITQFGALDIVVNNAAILRDAMIFKGDPADFDRVLEVNLSAAYYLAHAATPKMREQAKAGRPGGRLINMVSSAAFYGNFGVSAYASAKAGLLGLTRVMALELERAGITANAIMPFAATRVTESLPPVTELLKEYRARALQLPAQPVAVACAWLASDLGAGISGQLIGVRGGDVFLMSQPRPIAHAIARDQPWDEQGLASAAATNFSAHYFAIQSDLDAFNTDPIIQG
ncbi:MULTISPECIES: SDR family oxidoreductase [unclassified Iodidimonas]|jgi:NAD(P)-dependent dehydrogenase (short-subunit alcohol dehydrogenase family)|uniref:SDR family NAD(P)-dependent oxidoreductase n=1 Tax=unclassified Iodidimonas TaxID=2626145 RepID=UPI002482D23A|nr:MULTISPECIES: SDR family oxidoreductase [unclassified Iodidimonas]